MLAHCASAQTLAEWLEQQPHVSKVYYAGLPSHPQHELAKRQQTGFGAVVSFEVVGGQEAAWRFIDATRLISITANLGDTKTTITHPATTTHGRLSVEARTAAGIRDSLIRLAIGLEDVADLKADLLRGLAAL
jgi:O-succinylhomoserine sulfhydrylase